MQQFPCKEANFHRDDIFYLCKKKKKNKEKWINFYKALNLKKNSSFWQILIHGGLFFILIFTLDFSLDMSFCCIWAAALIIFISVQIQELSFDWILRGQRWGWMNSRPFAIAYSCHQHFTKSTINQKCRLCSSLANLQVPLRHRPTCSSTFEDFQEINTFLHNCHPPTIKASLSRTALVLLLLSVTERPPNSSLFSSPAATLRETHTRISMMFVPVEEKQSHLHHLSIFGTWCQGTKGSEEEDIIFIRGFAL